MSSYTLPNQLDKFDTPIGMVKAKYAYHVTNIPVIYDADDNATNEPQFDFLKYHLAKDRQYDRDLVGLPCVFFTTTLCRGSLPTTSPYPVDSRPGVSHWRVRVPLQRFAHYHMHHVEGIRSQIRLIFIREEDKLNVEGTPRIHRLNETTNDYLYQKNGSWYTNDYQLRKYFTNFVVLHDFPLEFCPKNENCVTYNCETGDCSQHCTWDTVPRSYCGPGFPLSRDELAAEMRSQWSRAKRSAQHANQ